MCPILFVRASKRSHLTEEAAERREGLAHVRIVVVPQAAHSVMGDNPHAFRREIGEFLSAQGFR